MDVYAAPQTRVLISGRTFNLHVTGDHGPTIILSAGYLGCALDWLLVQFALSRKAQVVSYDNAGLGFSDEGPLPRDTKAIVSDLRTSLAMARISPPYILVGHSAGSIRMRLFAALHPEEVSGVVMVDPVTVDWEQRLFGGRNPGMVEEISLHKRLLRLEEVGELTSDTPEFKARYGTPHPGLTLSVNSALTNMRLKSSYLRTAIAEAEGLWSAHSDAVVADGSLGSIPMVVLSAGRIGQSLITGGDPRLVEKWFEMHEAIAALSSQSRREIVDAGHNIPIEAPQSVIGAVAGILA